MTPDPNEPVVLASAGDDAPPTAEEERAARTRKRWTIIAVVAVVIALAALGVLGALLLGAGNSSPAKDVMACIPSRDFTKGKGHTCPPKGAPHVTGLVQDTTKTGFDIVTLDGKHLSFKVRPADRPYIDVQHAQSHASLGQPIRVYTKVVDGDTVIIYLDDPPLTFGNGMGQ